MPDQLLDAWTSADTYAAQVACRVSAALRAAGIDPREIGGACLDEALVRQNRPLTVRQLDLAARPLGADPAAWLRR